MADVVVMGVVGRDLVVAVDQLPAAGGSVPVTQRLEMLGGAANQAVACRQLGCSAALLGVVGADDAGAAVLHQAQRDGLDVSAVARREGADTALMVDVVTADGVRRLFEHVPPAVLTRAEDVRAAAPLLRSARAVLVQLQQPREAVLETVRTASAAGALVAADGSLEEDRSEVLGVATVVRADETESARLVGRSLDDVTDVVRAARELLGAGPAVVALSAGKAGNVLAWRGGHVLLPHLGGPPVDPTGAGDAFLAALVVALLRGHNPETAGWWASAAAAATVARLGGRPDLDAAAVSQVATESRTARAGG
ncbi:PfkB family carbohydrate kinase [Georgenia sp. TF02-10]|uniref:PfkB family carbohydrate kinase n=1 Tax=Georgenia sp. TF02-10 TaxID=2917725 RepID=UPI001FA7C508|nr:PfkB family carbohydrate kinase [Georgenia sp. TF02-10]UNX53543.1 PfkB family carbohydrate kinase [Georgenia sp. TF02-10]